jgi:hypothetical protein
LKFPCTKNKKNIDTKQGPPIAKKKKKDHHDCATTETKKKTKAKP